MGDERDRLGEHGDDADARERAEGAHHVGADAAEDRDHEVGASVHGEVLEHDREPIRRVRGHGGEPVDQVVARVAADAEELAGARDDLHPPLEPDETRHH